MDINPKSEKDMDEEEIDFGDLTTADIGIPISPTRIQPKGKSFRLFAIGIVTILILISAKFLNPQNTSAILENKQRTFHSVTRGNVTEPWKKGNALHVGDLINTKVLSKVPSLGWQAIYSSNGSRITTDQDIANSIISANPGISEVFPSELKIANANGSEVVVTIVCARKALENHYPSLKILLEWLDGVMNRDMNFMDGCEGTRTRLR